MKEKLKNHKVVQQLHEIFSKKFSECRLVGGAVIDIIDGRNPKDYDLIVSLSVAQDTLLENGFVWVTDTSYATTFQKEDVKVQVLKTKTQDFDFNISTSYVRLDKKGMSFNLKEFDIQNKKLIPQNYKDKKNILNSLSRIPHWRKKGYNIDDSTYYSLLNGLNKKEINITYPYSS